MNNKVICGIQQVGIGVNDFVEAWRWYYDHFGFEVKIVDDEGVAERMLPYTGGKPQPRRSGIAVNIRGGGGFEIWQPKGRELNYLKEPVQLGDLGILIAKVRRTTSKAPTTPLLIGALMSSARFSPPLSGRSIFT